MATMTIAPPPAAAAPPVTFMTSHTMGRQELRGGNGFYNPVSLARGAGDLLYVLSRGTETPALFPCKRVTICTVDEELVGQFGEKVHPEEANESAPDGCFFWPTAVALDRQGNAYVADEWLNRISIFTGQGEWIGKWGVVGSGPGQFNRPAGLAIDAADQLYLVDSVNSRVQVFDTAGNYRFHWGRFGSDDGQFNMPWGIALDPAGNVYVADWRNDRIQKFSSDGQFLLKFGQSGAGPGQFRRPTGVAVDQDGLVYVADYKNDRLQVFTAGGDYITQLTGDASLSRWGMERVALDPVALKGREIAQDLPERERRFQGPIAVTVDAENRVFVAEVARHRVQVFRKQSPIFQGLPL